MPGKRITKAEKEIRVAKVATFLLNGMKRGDIWQYLTNPKNEIEWDISIRTLDRYIKDATAAIKESSQIDRDFEIGKSKGRLEILWQRNISIQDFKAALAVVKEVNNLFGLNEPIRITDSTPRIDASDFDRSVNALSETLGDLISREME